jgi:phosphoribosylanthranilate isomerase
VAAGVACLQFHGDETAEWCESFERPYIKAVRVAGAVDAAALVSAYPRAGAFLLDAHVPGLPGGTGKSFDWAHWPRTCARPLMLAGGLDADNVASAIADTRPFAVDVCSGVESEQPGVKCPKKMERFVNEVLRASQRL